VTAFLQHKLLCLVYLNLTKTFTGLVSNKIPKFGRTTGLQGVLIRFEISRQNCQWLSIIFTTHCVKDYLWCVLWKNEMWQSWPSNDIYCYFSLTASVPCPWLWVLFKTSWNYRTTEQKLKFSKSTRISRNMILHSTEHDEDCLRRHSIKTFQLKYNGACLTCLILK